MGNLNDPAFVEWLATLALSIAVALVIAAVLAASAGRLLALPPEHKLWMFIVGFAFLCSVTTMPLTDQRTWSDTVLFISIPALAILIYFLPTAAAIIFDHPNFQSIFVMNLCFGWTVAGWIVTLVWAVRKPAVQRGASYKITPFGAVPVTKGDSGGPGGANPG